MKDLWFVLLLQNGMTLDRAGLPVEFEDGYLVSLDKYGTKLPVVALTPELFELLLENYCFIAETLWRSEDTPHYVGVWVHDSFVYIDINRWFEDRDEALEFARENGQLAVWDCANKREIWVE